MGHPDWIRIEPDRSEALFFEGRVRALSDPPHAHHDDVRSGEGERRVVGMAASSELRARSRKRSEMKK